MNAKITFKNEQKLSEHEVDKKFNDRRVAFVPHIENFISNHELFKDSEVAITFSHGGVSSIVCILDTADKKYVLKIPLSINFSKGEAEFLKVWETAGVKVPHVFEKGLLNEHAYILMEFIEAKTLIEKYKYTDLLEKRSYVEIGAIMRMMHIPKSHGFGYRVNDEGEFKTFKDWVYCDDIQERIVYVKENMLLGEEHGSLSTALEILISFAGETNESSYCHEDVGTHNIFDTQPLTIFDPNPRFNLGIWDLARTMFSTVWHGEPDDVRAQLIEGYFGNEPYNTKALHSALLLNANYKLPYSHKTKKVQNIKNVQDYFTRTKEILD